MNLTSDDIAVGKLYRAKRPTKVWGEIFNDRVVLYISHDRSYVQYDSKSVRDGRHYPKVPMERFLKWASHEVTDDANTP